MNAKKSDQNLSGRLFFTKAPTSCVKSKMGGHPQTCTRRGINFEIMFMVLRNRRDQMNSFCQQKTMVIYFSDGWYSHTRSALLGNTAVLLQYEKEVDLKKKEIVDANLVIVRESVKKKEYVSYATKSFQNNGGFD